MTPREMANSICERLRSGGYQALLVGGCVRDILLGREPADYDVATDASPDQVMAIFPNSVGVGAQFGVVGVQSDGLRVEVATFRADAGYSDGRHPDAVVFTRSPKEDVERRDFTINGLLMRHDTGEVLDYVGGHADLRAGIIRAIGEPDRRFAEDKLRLMRAVRFAARLGFEIETRTLAAIRAHAREIWAPRFQWGLQLSLTPIGINQISGERLRDELTKLLTEGAARRGFELLDETDLLSVVLPEISAMEGVQQPPQFHPEGDVWIHTRMMIERLPAGCSPTLAWGVLLHDVGKPPTFKSAEETGDRIRFDGHVDVGVRMAETLCRRLRFSNEDTEQIVALVANHMRFKDVEQMRASTLKRFVRLSRFEEHLELHRLDCVSSHGRLESYEFVQRILTETPAEQIRPQRLLTGGDLLEMGYKPGPIFSDMLRGVEDAQLEGVLRTKEEARKYVLDSFGRTERQLANKHGRPPRNHAASGGI